MLVRTRRLLALGVLSLLAGLSHGAQTPPSAVYSFDLPPQVLADSLRSIARQTATNILFDPDSVENLTAPAVHDRLSVADAVYRVLDGTQLHAKQTADDTMMVQLDSDSTAANPQRRLSTESAAYRSAGTAALLAGGYGIIPVAQSTEGQPAAASATNQNPPAQGAGASKDELAEIVVTGTLIRGVKPAGANVITMDAGAIEATGATSSNELLQNIPQLAEFGNTNQQITTVNFQVTVDRPNIRNLPGAGTSGGSTTLVMVDGHRLVGAGIKQTAPDPNIVPPNVLERVDVLPDGGSSIYGSDAIGGVINFITRRHFDGVEIEGRYGFADAYKTYDVSATLGHDWESGSAYIAYTHTDNSPLFGYDRDYVRKYTTSGGPNPDITCTPSNVVIAATNTVYAVPGLLPNTANTCDQSKYSTIFSGNVRNSVYSSIAQDFNNGAVKLDVKGYYASQALRNYGNLTSTGTITAANPFYERVSDNPAPQPAHPEVAQFDWSSVLGTRSSQLLTTITSWGVTPTISIDLGSSGWELREMLNYGGSTTLVDNQQINPTALVQALGGTTTDTALNPYDLTATNPNVISNIRNYELYGRSEQRLIDNRLVADGALMKLPGGDVHVAVGGEYINENYKAKQGNFVPGTEGTVPYTEASRDSYAAFAELSIPIFGKPNAMTGIQSLILDISGRYDHYSDFGGTTNPKIALTYEPLDWVKIRGNWGTSFNAPSLADTAAVDNSLFVAPAIIYPSVLPGQFSPAQSFWPLIFTQGGLPDLKPQTGRTYEIGGDISPPVVPNLKLSLTYYHIDFNDIISTPNVSSPINFWTYYTNSYRLNPTNAQVLALAAQVPNGLALVAPYLTPGSLPIYAIIDDRRRNQGNAKLSGLDLAINYFHSTGFGSWDASLNGSYDLNSETQPLAGLPYVDNLAVDNSRYRFSAVAGANIHALRMQATLNYVAGFDTTPTPTNNNQMWIKAFTVVNLFFRYDLSGIESTSLTHNLALTLSINNAFDVDPPIYTGTYNTLYNGYANGSTVGRLIQFGFSKKF